MAMQAHQRPYPHHHEEGVAAAAKDLASAPHGEESLIQGQAIKQIAQVCPNHVASTTVETSVSDEDAGESLMQPPLKRLRCRSALQIRHLLTLNVAPLAEQKSDGGCNLQTLNRIGEEQITASLSVTEVDDSGQVPSDEDHTAALISKAGSSDGAVDEEEEETECSTPTAREQRIPESTDLVCPPPPVKRKPTAFKRNISTSWAPPSSAYNNRPNLLIKPPDLHTYPECIRALFDK